MHQEPFGFAGAGQQSTHVVWPDGPDGREFVIARPHRLSPHLDYVMTLYDDGTARVSRLADCKHVEGERTG